LGSCDGAAAGAVFGSIGVAADGAGVEEAAGAIAIGAAEGAMIFVVGVTAREVFEVAAPF
jgi:hypothetical protein